ncbi:hypothetical protein Brsp07_04523 [Brucella sp. NBRC 14130]|uniref:hypothetical protein n=1 Tax=Brucella sp. NBRC 14130 TaxID=3075483 RepID=UPI003097C998
MKLTKADYKALDAVKRGIVKRIYRADGNTFKRTSGVSAVALWRLDRMKLIGEDGTTMTGGVMATEVGVVLTAAGERALLTAS